MKTAKKDVHGLLKSFYTLLFISLGASVFLSYFIFFIPLNASFVREQENYFRSEVRIKASSDDQMILDLIAGQQDRNQTKACGLPSRRRGFEGTEGLHRAQIR